MRVGVHELALERLELPGELLLQENGLVGVQEQRDHVRRRAIRVRVGARSWPDRRSSSLLRSPVITPRHSLVRLALAVSAAIAALACRPAPRGAPEPLSVTSATLLTGATDEAVMAVAMARCERALSCGRIAGRVAQEDEPSCLERIGPTVRVEIAGCPPAIDHGALLTCLSESTRQPCEAVAKPPVACRPAALCAR